MVNSPIILAIDTVTQAQQLALVEGDKVLARRTHYSISNHADSLLKNIEDMFVQQGIEGRKIDLVGVGVGPGSFTGARVGLAVAKAIALAAGAPILGVSSLLSMASPLLSVLPPSSTVASVIDARRSEVYFSLYAKDEHGKVNEILCAQSASPEVFLEKSEGIKNLYVVGNATRQVSQLKECLQARENIVLPQPWDGPSSVSIALLAWEFFQERGADSLADLEPNYVRLSDAEINYAKKNA